MERPALVILGGHKFPTTEAGQARDLIKHLDPKVKSGGYPEEYATRELFNALFNLLAAGVPGTYNPHDLPLWRIVYT
jgi:hypothetical protein